MSPSRDKNIQDEVGKLCDKSCCEEIEVKIHVDDAGKNSNLQDGINNFAPSWKGKLTVGGKDYTKKLKCGSPVSLP